MIMQSSIVRLHLYVFTWLSFGLCNIYGKEKDAQSNLTL